ncbi:MAG: cadmium-translocating P-type ATPase [Clostridiales bacterium]|nr:cadmium-translocating P-type ATPase [Clostridiales bacterium]
MKYTLILENLNCAHCAAKIENKITQTSGYENVSFNFATKLLKFESASADPVPDIQQICDSIEDGVSVIDKRKAVKSGGADRQKFNSDFLLLIISALLAIAAAVIEFTTAGEYLLGGTAVFVLYAASALLAGFRVFIKGVKSVLKLRIDETTLLTVAVIAAFCLGEFVEAAMVTVLFALGEIIEDKAVDASRRDIQKIAQIRPDTAVILTDGKERTVEAESVEINSEVVIKPYEKIPLDGVIIKGKTTVDTSALTGESLPTEVCEGSEVLSGSVNGSNLIVIRTTKKFGDSTATRILKLVEEAATKKGQSEKLISRFASVYTPIIIIISILMAAIPPLIGIGSPSEWIYRALVCLVASCPCAIVISVPLAYYSGIGSASNTGVLIKGGKYIEELAKADTFVFDKTGTLTNGKLSVESVTALSDCTEDEILALAAACEKYSSHPIAEAIRERAGKLSLPALTNYSENAGCGTSAVYDGKKIECGGVKNLSEKQKKSVEKNASVFVLCDGDLIGAISVSDTVRSESAKVISQLKGLRISRTTMLTGDSKSAANRVSGELGLDEYKAELMPADKLEAVESLKRSSRAVCFVGDGINDAPVLSASDCGIAMGFGSEAAIEAADVVLASGNLNQLPDAVKLSRRVMNTVKTNIAFSLAVKAAVIILAAMGLASMWMSVIADTGVSVLCVLYSARLLHRRKN